ncbi:hypothetical protein ABT024_05175 [Streptomyces sp. NPDC002812]|uniref:hypothetical protein n=1 Tax=Streptomyces sp. NPDC002812 TaxID=3154434 RepID=UPI00331FF15D
MPQHPHAPNCECAVCLCDCGRVEYEPMEKCHPDCSYMSVGREAPELATFTGYEDPAYR